MLEGQSKCTIPLLCTPEECQELIAYPGHFLMSCSSSSLKKNKGRRQHAAPWCHDETTLSKLKAISGESLRARPSNRVLESCATWEHKAQPSNRSEEAARKTFCKKDWNKWVHERRGTEKQAIKIESYQVIGNTSANLSTRPGSAQDLLCSHQWRKRSLHQTLRLVLHSLWQINIPPPTLLS